MACLACGRESEKGERRLLTSGSTKHVLPVFLETAASVVDGKIDDEKLSDGHVCKTCFRELEKLQRLQKQVKTITEGLQTSMKRAVPIIPVVSASTSASETEGSDTLRRGTKRPLTEPCESPRQSKRRLMFSTRRTVVQ